MIGQMLENVIDYVVSDSLLELCKGLTFEIHCSTADKVEFQQANQN